MLWTDNNVINVIIVLKLDMWCPILKYFFYLGYIDCKKRRGRPSLLVREGKRVEGGRKKPGTKSRGKKWEEKRITKKERP